MNSCCPMICCSGMRAARFFSAFSYADSFSFSHSSAHSSALPLSKRSPCCSCTAIFCAVLPTMFSLAQRKYCALEIPALLQKRPGVKIASTIPHSLRSFSQFRTSAQILNSRTLFPAHRSSPDRPVPAPTAFFISLMPLSPARSSLSDLLSQNILPDTVPENSLPDTFSSQTQPRPRRSLLDHRVIRPLSQVRASMPGRLTTSMDSNCCSCKAGALIETPAITDQTIR